ncbi:MAG: TetR/AcrR family transcriptional regulator [Oleispira sp.]|nr:TetR/AcrR family transcriptional regulator [Oleispira sp.]
MKPRKSPKQSRSKVTVEAILQATTHILLAEGVQAFTTNHVAERAGVSIGSLYQYFPNKESLIAALIDQHVQHEVACLLGIIDSWQGVIDETLFRKLIQTFIQLHLDEIELTKLLHQQVHSLECRAALRKATYVFELLFADMLAQKLAKPKDHPRIKIKAFIIINSIDSVVQTALVENSNLLSDAIFVDELVDLTQQVFNQV